MFLSLLLLGKRGTNTAFSTPTVDDVSENSALPIEITKTRNSIAAIMIAVRGVMNPVLAGFRFGIITKRRRDQILRIHFQIQGWTQNSVSINEHCLVRKKAFLMP